MNGKEKVNRMWFMKRTTVLLLLMVASSMIAGAQLLLPPSVQQFLEERELRQRFAARGTDLPSAELRYVPSREVNGCEMVDAFVAIESETVLPVLREMGVIVNCKFDGFVTAQVPVNRLEVVSRLRGVTDLEISPRLTLCTDSTMAVSHVNMLHDGLVNHLPASYDGSGVIIGIIDVGFDYQHRAFRDKNNPAMTRIARVYSTTDKSGHPACYNANVIMPGSVFMGNEIYQLTTDNATSTHGTHTSSIAAGTHVNGYGGMAPGADIVLCAVSVLDGSMSAVEVANCVRYIDSYADSVGQPCVMSISVSTPNGQRDGNDFLSKVVKQIMGPGRIFVISSGNDGGRIAYAHKLASPSNPLRILFKSKTSSSVDSTYYYSGLLADIWMREANYTHYYKFHILDQWSGNIVWESARLSAKNKILSDAFSDYFIPDLSRDSVGYIEGLTASSYGKYRLQVTIRNLQSKEYALVNGVRMGRYALGLSIYPRKQTAVEIDAWTCNSSSGLGAFDRTVLTLDGQKIDNYYAIPSDSCSIGTYAVSDSTISAGAYAARNSYYSMVKGQVVTDNAYTIGDIAYFSSYQAPGVGPTQEALPTVCAPGIDVVAAGSRYSYFARGSINTVMQSDDGSYWGVMSGTSMAAPTVAGIIALWLQANPELSVADVKDIISQSSINDSFTMGPHRCQFGPNGKIDAFAGMQIVLKNLRPARGDVNGDGLINIADVVIVINCALGNNNYGVNLSYADIDGDGSITVADVTLLIQIVMHG